MIAASVDKRQIKKTGLAIIAIALLALTAVYAAGRLREARPAAGNGGISGATDEERAAYLLSLGYETGGKSYVTEVAVPKEFDERFTEYNEMLKAQGFDLEPLKGENVRKCVYTVLNAPDETVSTSAVLLVYEDKIAAGHLLEEGDTTRILPLFEAAGEAPAKEGEASEEEAAFSILPEEPEEAAVKPEEPEVEETAFPID